MLSPRQHTPELMVIFMPLVDSIQLEGVNLAVIICMLGDFVKLTY